MGDSGAWMSVLSGDARWGLKGWMYVRMGGCTYGCKIGGEGLEGKKSCTYFLGCMNMCEVGGGEA